jgi:hypothetical protein
MKLADHPDDFGLIHVCYNSTMKAMMKVTAFNGLELRNIFHLDFRYISACCVTSSWTQCLDAAILIRPLLYASCINIK